MATAPNKVAERLVAGLKRFQPVPALALEGMLVKIDVIAVVPA